ncbi:hypothetical protein C8034_v008019 [Colletotrichum sidae]|uniref:Uncharacterized protein n=1 Tax=Colletotrichum sidae TaxID=1347389 RepID=A0A4R8TQK5_9PEZI|nr:hypothetical protein C8034_v008019 [Colletotrichum sidae]
MALLRWLTSCVALSAITTAYTNVPVSLPTRLVAWSPTDWFEDIAVRPNGNLLLANLKYAPSIYELTDSTLDFDRFRINSVKQLVGITETTPDVFALVGTNHSLSINHATNSSVVFKVDCNDNASIEPQLIARLPEAVMPSGVTTVPGNPRIVLVADSGLGLLWRVDMETGKVSVGAQVPEMRSRVAGGISAVKIRNDYLWWTNLSGNGVYKIRVDKGGNVIQGATAELVVHLPSARLEDLTFGPGDEDTLWVVTGADGQVFAVNSEGDILYIVEPADLVDATAVVFGRTERDFKMLYVTTRRGKVVVIDTTGLGDGASHNQNLCQVKLQSGGK